jgi:hypothetical protein
MVMMSPSIWGSRMKWIMSRFFLLLVFMPSVHGEWTWRYRKAFNTPEREQHKALSVLSFSKLEVPHFSQLLFSWNAFRPHRGFFRFLVQVRSAKTHTWHDWHTMIEWG